MEKGLKKKETNFGITQEKLSELVDITPSYVSEIERGSTVTSLATISKISQILDVSLDYLVFGTRKNNSSTVFSEMFKSLSNENQELYINLCECIYKVLNSDKD